MIQKFQRSNLSQTEIRNVEIMSKKEREIQQSGELRQCLKKVDKAPYISFEEENHLWRKIKEKGGDKNLEDKIFEANLKLVIRIAKKYNRDNNNLTFLELILAGEEGLKRAIEVFKWRRRGRGKFSTYAKWWIKRAIIEATVNGRLPSDLVSSRE